MSSIIPTAPGKIWPFLFILFISSLFIGMGFSIGNAIGWDIASFLGFAVG